MNSEKEKKVVDPPKSDINFILNLLSSNKLIDTKNEIDKQRIRFPNSPILFNILGAVFAGQNQINDAIKNYKKAIKINPKYAQAYNNLGAALQKSGEINEAIEYYKHAIIIKKDFVEAYNNLGNLYQDIGKKKDALNIFYKVIKIKPDYAEVYNLIGMVLDDLSQFDEALTYYKKSIDLKPNNYFTYNNIGNLLSNIGKHDEATSAYYKSLKFKSDNASTYSNLLLNLNYKLNFDSKLYLSEAKKFGLNCKPKNKISIKYQYEKNPKKLKIGFVSADFGNHPGGFFTLSTLRELRKKNFELVAYSNKNRQDGYSSHFKPLFTKWNTIEKKNDHEVVDQILKDGIHILIELQGHSAQNRIPIFMHKAAPIQASWLSQGTLGVSEIDYLIGSPCITPKSEENHFVEKIWRLPEITQCFTAPNFNVEINPLPALKNKYITFGCINNLTKINDDVIYLWSKILSSIPKSHAVWTNKAGSYASLVNCFFSSSFFIISPYMDPSIFAIQSHSNSCLYFASPIWDLAASSSSWSIILVSLALAV